MHDKLPSFMPATRDPAQPAKPHDLTVRLTVGRAVFLAVADSYRHISIDRQALGAYGCGMADTRKVVINKCYGGFSLSPDAVARIAELQGRPCYFFHTPIVNGKFSRSFVPLTLEEARKAFVWSAFDVPNPNEMLKKGDWHTMTEEERKAQNAVYSEHEIDNRPSERDNAHLVQAVEELGEKANGGHAELRVVEIPADVEWTVDEYDGLEHIAQVHNTWG